MGKTSKNIKFQILQIRNSKWLFQLFNSLTATVLRNFRSGKQRNLASYVQPAQGLIEQIEMNIILCHFQLQIKVLLSNKIGNVLDFQQNICMYELNLSSRGRKQSISNFRNDWFRYCSLCCCCGGFYALQVFIKLVCSDHCRDCDFPRLEMWIYHISCKQPYVHCFKLRIIICCSWNTSLGINRFFLIFTSIF